MFMQMRPYEVPFNAANARGKQRESFSAADYRGDQFMIALKRLHRRGPKGGKASMDDALNAAHDTYIIHFHGTVTFEAN